MENKANKLKIEAKAKKLLDKEVSAEVNISYKKDTPNFDLTIEVNLDKDPEISVFVEKTW